MIDFAKHETKRNAIECLKTIHECAEKAGIRNAVFINFGLLLGIVRCGDFIGHDGDVDVCVRADMITPQQELNYFNYLYDKGMFFSREKLSYRTDENGFDSSLIKSKIQIHDKKVRLTWFSLRKRPHYPKFCHWLMFPWNGFYWHTKSGEWVKNTKFSMAKYGYTSKDAAIMLGIKKEYLDKFLTKNFYGVNLQIPVLAGSCLDHLYTGWLVPKKGGSSDKKIVCVVKKWEDEKTWKIVIN